MVRWNKGRFFSLARSDRSVVNMVGTHFFDLARNAKSDVYRRPTPQRIGF